jgi:hypothetical protein
MQGSLVQAKRYMQSELSCSRHSQCMQLANVTESGIMSEIIGSVFIDIDIVCSVIYSDIF